jgi:transposase
MLVAAFSFALQCYIAQTHIHSVPQGFDGAVKTATDGSSTPAKTPIDHSPMECPLCQAVMHAGAVVVSATPVLNPTLAWIATVRLTFTVRPSLDVTTHQWQSRAPPRL